MGNRAWISITAFLLCGALASCGSTAETARGGPATTVSIAGTWQVHRVGEPFSQSVAGISCVNQNLCYAITSSTANLSMRTPGLATITASGMRTTPLTHWVYGSIACTSNGACWLPYLDGIYRLHRSKLASVQYSNFTGPVGSCVDPSKFCLSIITCHSDTECLGVDWSQFATIGNAVAPSPKVAMYNGAIWKVVSLPGVPVSTSICVYECQINPSQPVCFSQTDCSIEGTYWLEADHLPVPYTVTYSWNGAAWSASGSTAHVAVAGRYCYDSSLCWIWGQDSASSHGPFLGAEALYGGKSHSLRFPFSTNSAVPYGCLSIVECGVSAISCVSQATCWIAGLTLGNEPFLLRWNQTGSSAPSVQKIDVNLPGRVSSIVCPSSTYCVAIGGELTANTCSGYECAPKPVDHPFYAVFRSAGS